MHIPKTIVISCAGMGNRLGFGKPKALLEIAGKPIIYHHLDQLNNFDDVRIVVGYDYRRIVDVVRAYRRDVVFVLNHNFRTTNTLASLCLGANFGNDLIVSIDGDLLVRPRDLSCFLASNTEVLGYTEAYSDEPVYCGVEQTPDGPIISSFTRNQGIYEWTGLALVNRSRLISNTGHVYQCLENDLPLPGMLIDCREIDTPQDLERAREWSRSVFTPIHCPS